MRLQQLRLDSEFDVVTGNDRSQAAVMVIGPGASEGGPANRHRGADQWLYVIDGEGEALVNGQAHGLKTGSLLLVEHGEQHEIRNTGATPLRTLNFYVPPAYDPDGQELPSGKS